MDNDIEKVSLEHFRENKKEIFEVGEIARRRLENDYKIVFSDKEIVPSVAYTCLTCICEYLSTIKSIEEDVSINFFDIFDIGVTYQEDVNGEKDGNYTPCISPSERVKEAILKREKLVREVDPDSKNSVVIEPKKDSKDIEQLRNRFLIAVKDRNRVNTHVGAVTATMVVVYLEELFNYLLDHHIEGETSNIKFGTMMKVGLTYDDEGLLRPFIIPFEDFRLHSKNDGQS